MKTSHVQLLFGSSFALLAVVLGAFAAHALKEVLTPDQLDSFQTGVRYQMYHALILIVLALKSTAVHFRLERWITACVVTGTLLFSFSIYLLNLQDLFGFEARWLGPITPFGGLFLISGWSMLVIESLRLISTKKA